MTLSTVGQKIRVMVVEDHVLVRMGLVAAANAEPDMEVVAEADDAEQVWELSRAQPIDVVVLDLRLPGTDGLAIIRTLRNKFRNCRILVLSSYAAVDEINRAMQEGASGYVVKGMPLEILLEGIRAVHAGETFLPREISRRIKERIVSDISDRELEILRLIAGGKSNKEIGTKLGIVEGTVKAHLARIFGKLGAADRAQAIAIAIKRKLILLE